MSIRPEFERSAAVAATASLDPARIRASHSVIGCLWAVMTPQIPMVWREETDLARDLALTGTGFLRVGELLEEENGIIITSVELIDLVLQGATAGKLVDLVTAKIQAAAR